MSDDSTFDIWVKRAKDNPIIVGILIAASVCTGALAIINGAKALFPSMSDPNLNYQAASGTISDPKGGGRVLAHFVASGSAKNVGKGTYLWLAVEIKGTIWPKEGGVFVDENGGWSQKVSEEGHPDQFALSLWAANPRANNQLAVWREHCLQTHDCPGW